VRVINRAPPKHSRRSSHKTVRLLTVGLFAAALENSPLRTTVLKLAPKVGLEPTTHRLTADCSTIELLWMPKWTRNLQTSDSSVKRYCRLILTSNRSLDREHKSEAANYQIVSCGEPAVPHHAVTTVPTFSPKTTRRRLCGLKRSKTMIGILLSMQSENAVESITFNCFWRASR
jgi:hypothetical protein